MSSLPPDVLAILVCPKCHGAFVAEPEALRCDHCRLRYRIDDGIPVLLIDEATAVEETPASGAGGSGQS
jgi:uncharacterized protein YbaR (Trm112 family)